MLIQLFPLFWKAVGIVENNCNLQVVAVRNNGASSNRTMHRMHLQMEEVKFNDSVVYRTITGLVRLVKLPGN